MKILGVIPARYASTRFPGKPLAYIAGKPMIQWVYEQCIKAGLDAIVVATDDERIRACVESFGGSVIMTSQDHLNGTSRCAEVAIQLPDYEAIINIQGDEPTINPVDIKAVAELLKSSASIATLFSNLSTDEISNPNAVKVAIKEGEAPLFSRSMDKLSAFDNIQKHVGIYGFQRSVLSKVIQLNPSQSEIEEQLEQLRWIDNGYTIAITEATDVSRGVDTPEDIKVVEDLIILDKMKSIKALVTDVDGVLTDGMITYDSAGIERKSFNVKDGQICRILKNHGFKLGIITGRSSPMVDRRAAELGFDDIVQGSKDKSIAIKLFAEKHNLSLDEIAYIGDDLNDLPAYNLVGLSAAPSDAPSYIQERATVKLKTAGGNGAFREFADQILIAQNLPII